MGIKGSNKSRTVQQGTGTQNKPSSCVPNHCLLITKNTERNRSRPGTQSSLPLPHAMSSRKGGEPHSPLCSLGTVILAGHSLPIQPLPQQHTSTPPWTQVLCREVAPQRPVPHSPGHQDHSCGPAVEPSPATDWSCASDRKPGRAVHACGTLGGVDARGWSQARLCNHIVWKGADRRAEPRRATVTLHCLEGCGGKGVRGEEKPQEAGKSTELEVGKLGAW